jgi:hypothetical protein
MGHRSVHAYICRSLAPRATLSGSQSKMLTISRTAPLAKRLDKILFVRVTQHKLEAGELRRIFDQS